MDTIEMMQVYCRVVEAGSFTRAADQLGFSKALVSKYVQMLEKKLDCRLLHRTTRTMSLTDAGDLYYQRCIGILEQIKMLDREVSGDKKRVTGRIRISIPHTFGELFIVPHLSSLLAQYPDLILDLVFTDAHISLIDEHVDVAIRIGKLEDSTLIAKPLGVVIDRLCASPFYLKERGMPEKPEDLCQHRLILDTNIREGLWRFMNPEGQECSMKVNGHVRVNSAKAVRELLLQGEGIALGPSFALDDALKEGLLVQIFPTYKFYEYSISAVYPSARHVPEKVTVFIEYMKKVWGGCVAAKF